MAGHKGQLSLPYRGALRGDGASERALRKSCQEHRWHGANSLFVAEGARYPRDAHCSRPHMTAIEASR